VITAGPESAQVDPAAGVPLAGQQVGYQVAAQHEEDIDAEEATRQYREVLVKDKHRNHGESTDAVESGCPR
jgi:hypothetical protein